MEAFKNKLSMSLVRIISNHLEKQLNHQIQDHSHGPSSNLVQHVLFDKEAFCSRIEKQLDSLELKQRAEFIANEIHCALPENLKVRYQIIRNMLHTRKHSNLKVSQQSDENGLCGWAMMCLGPVVANHGLSNFKLSLELLKDMTAYFSCEFDVRPFIKADQEQALAILSSWVTDPDYHVRRLVSEGCRPRLPWGMQLTSLINDPTPTMPILIALRDDEEEYVRRSVANHLNDIAKDHPDLVAQIAHDWLNDSRLRLNSTLHNNREKLVKHACRTLIKQGHPVALAAFGIHPAKIQLDALTVKKDSVNLGDTMPFELSISSHANKPQTLIIDYLIYHKKANGSLSPKVFKWKKVNLAAHISLTIVKNHAFKIITTRTYYSGEHAVSVRINGKDYGYTEFELIT